MKVIDLLVGGPVGGPPDRPVAIRRYFLFHRDKGPQIYRHEIFLPDPEWAPPHAHPHRMLSICYSGGYREVYYRNGIRRFRRHRKYIPRFMGLKAYHKIIEVKSNTKTLALFGRKSKSESHVWYEGQAWTAREWMISFSDYYNI